MQPTLHSLRQKCSFIQALFMKRQKRWKQKQQHIHLEDRNLVTKTEPDSHWDNGSSTQLLLTPPLWNKNRLLIVMILKANKNICFWHKMNKNHLIQCAWVCPPSDCILLIFTLLFFTSLTLASSAASPAASFRYLFPTLLSNHFRSTNTSLKCSRSNWKKRVMACSKS